MDFMEYFTPADDLDSINYNCTNTSVLCVGGSKSDSIDLLQIVSCGNCFSVLNKTIGNFESGAYWYNSPSHSFGFSSNSTIQLNNCDISDCTRNPWNCTSKNSICWHLIGVGGWRLGSIVGLNTNTAYFKFIFLKK